MRTSKNFIKGSSVILSSLLSLNIWFINRLVSSVDASVALTNEHNIQIARLDEKVNSLRELLEQTIHNRKGRQNP